MLNAEQANQVGAFVNGLIHDTCEDGVQSTGMVVVIGDHEAGLHVTRAGQDFTLEVLGDEDSEFVRAVYATLTTFHAERGYFIRNLKTLTLTNNKIPDLWYIITAALD